MNVSFLIVVPTLDSYTLLPRLLSSLQAQTWTGWRLLFVDGDSGPKHREWLDQCSLLEPRCHWIPQNHSNNGIFGAMNQGFEYASSTDLLLFWGSDDWAASPDSLHELASSFYRLDSLGYAPDLIVASGRYVNSNTGKLSRITKFKTKNTITGNEFRRSLFLGSTPPHQATVFAPGSRSRLSSYADSFLLSADLVYFLQISAFSSLLVHCINLEIVHMADGGVSAQQTTRRLSEVKSAYKNSFGIFWFISFSFRYLRRLVSLSASFFC